MDIAKFPNCCGAYVLSDFGGTTTSMGDKGRKDNETIREFLKKKIYWHSDKAFLIAILNNTQYRNFGNVFLEEGFVNVSNGWNEGHPQTSPLHLMVWSRVPENKKE